MTKVVFIMHKRPDLTFEAFGQYWQGRHAEIASTMPGLRKYVQNHFRPESFQGEPPCDGVAELWFDSDAALRESLASPEGQAAVADLSEFCDMTRTRNVLAEEVNVV
jgi:uncharacterized protein (TIGR02118 family)